MTGRALQKEIIALARELGWKVAHFPVVKTAWGTWQTQVAADGKGFPDLLLVRDRIVVAEVKGTNDRLRPHQREWVDAFSLAGMPVYIWTPDRWERGDVDAVLRWRVGQPDPPTVPVIPGRLRAV